MPLSRMALLKGRPIHYLPAGEPSPHFQIQIAANGVMFRAAINARSFDKTRVQYLRKNITNNPYIKVLRDLAKRDGLYEFSRLFRKIEDQKNGALDYQRTGLIDPSDSFTEIPFDAAGPDNDINDFLSNYFREMASYGKARIYLFGQVWGPDTSQDDYFGYLPGAGIHDIHMNQGNPEASKFGKDNGTFQDGGIIVEFPKDDNAEFAEKWECFLIRFQTQTTPTDDQTGHPKPPPA
jgi:uncharacterized protein YukJ